MCFGPVSSRPDKTISSFVAVVVVIIVEFVCHLFSQFYLFSVSIAMVGAGTTRPASVEPQRTPLWSHPRTTPSTSTARYQDTAPPPDLTQASAHFARWEVSTW